MLDLVLAQAVNGLVLGFVYVLIAVGLSVIFGLLGIVNFAHGAFFALGAYFTVSLQAQFGWWSVVVAPAAVAEILYAVIGEVPGLAGAVQVTAAVVLPAVAVTPVGAPGAVAAPNL